MRTNIDIDDATLEAAMQAGPFKTKKEAVEAGLKLLARQAVYREILKWEGKLHWDGDDEGTAAIATGDAASATRVVANSPAAKKKSVAKPKANPVKRARHDRR